VGVETNHRVSANLAILCWDYSASFQKKKSEVPGFRFQPPGPSPQNVSYKFSQKPSIDPPSASPFGPLALGKEAAPRKTRRPDAMSQRGSVQVMSCHVRVLEFGPVLSGLRNLSRDRTFASMSTLRYRGDSPADQLFMNFSSMIRPFLPGQHVFPEGKDFRTYALAG
jgi:hypothetical protein